MPVKKKTVAGKKKVSGSAKVTRFKTQGGEKTAVTEYKGKNGRKTDVTTSSKRISGIDLAHKNGMKILKDIEKLERDLLKTKEKEAKLFLKKIINGKHDQLDALTK